MAEAVKLKLDLNLESYARDAKDCSGQGGCKFIDWIYVPGRDFSWRCPAWQYYGLDAYGMAGKMKIVRDLLAGRLDYNSPTLREITYACSLCGSCEVGCKRNLELEILLILETLRARLVEKGNGPMLEHLPVTENIENTGNLYGCPNTERFNWLPPEAGSADKADFLYFVGDIEAFRHSEIPRAAVKIMQAAGVDFMLLEGQRSSGNFLYTTGQIEKARDLAEINIEAIKSSGARTVVCSSAEDFKTLKVDYAKLLDINTSDLPYEVKHLVELVDEWVKDGDLKFKKPVDLKITYHDDGNIAWMSEPWLTWEGVRGEWGVLEPPRQMRRGTYGIYDAPRDILAAVPGVTLVEMPRHHENAYDCGAGGGVAEAFPELALWSASERLREASTTGAQAFVSASAQVKDNLLKSDKLEEYGLAIYDILEIVAMALK